MPDTEAYNDDSISKALRYDLLEWDFIDEVAKTMARGLFKGRTKRDYFEKTPRAAFIQVKINHALKHLAQFQRGGGIANLAACAANCMIAYVLTKLMEKDLSHPYITRAVTGDPLCLCKHLYSRHVLGVSAPGPDTDLCRDCSCSRFTFIYDTPSIQPPPFCPKQEPDWVEKPVQRARVKHCHCDHKWEDHATNGACKVAGCKCPIFYFACPHPCHCEHTREWHGSDGKCHHPECKHIIHASA